MLSLDVGFALYLAMTAVLTLWMGLGKSWLVFGLLVVAALVGLPWLGTLP
jgi:hypothetical protein